MKTSAVHTMRSFYVESTFPSPRAHAPVESPTLAGLGLPGDPVEDRSQRDHERVHFEPGLAGMGMNSSTSIDAPGAWKCGCPSKSRSTSARDPAWTIE